MLGVFNMPSYDLFDDTPLFNSYYYNNMKGNFIHATSRFLGLNQHNDCVPNSSFTNFNVLSLPISNYPMVTPVTIARHLPLI